MEAFCIDVREAICILREVAYILSVLFEIYVYIASNKKDWLSRLSSPDSSTKNEPKHTK